MSRRLTRAERRPSRSQASLTRARIVEAAIEMADAEGIAGLSMRKLGQVLGVDPMSLYNHVRDKDDLLDGMADAIVGEVGPAAEGGPWKADLRATVMTARQTMLRHPWAAAVLESRATPGEATMRYMEGVLGALRRGGFSVSLAHHGLHVLGSRVFGFSQDLFDDKAEPNPDPAAMASLAESWATAFPNIAELALAVRHEGGLGGCDDDVEFEFGLDLILDGMERLQEAATPSDRR
ncbi:MAG: TetR/AcrR family transcriptional regulator [Chloroflexota bacterium]